MTRRLGWTVAVWSLVALLVFLAVPTRPEEYRFEPPAPGDLLRIHPVGAGVRTTQLPGLPAMAEPRGGGVYDCATRTGFGTPDTYKAYFGGPSEDRTVYGLYDAAKEPEETRYGPPLLVVLFKPGTGTITEVYVVTLAGPIEHYVGGTGVEQLRRKWPTPCDALIPHRLLPADG